MKIITWNINSLRLRLPLLKRIIEENNPDVICLQETKVIDELFPSDAIKAFGYDYIAFHGEKSYNGVAIIAKTKIILEDKLKIADSDDTRHISVILNGDIELHNFYIPAGGDEPDVTINKKYQFKLNYVDSMRDWFTKMRKKNDKLIILGDFNIAPYEHDVWSHKQLANVVSHTEPEIARLLKLKEAFDWVDVSRHFVPNNEKLYTWWSYRNRDWQKSNRGRRLDHIWVTKPLENSLKSQTILTDCRNWSTPSDHVPLMVEI